MSTTPIMFWGFENPYGFNGASGGDLPVLWENDIGSSQGDGTPNSGSYAGILTGLDNFGNNPPWADTSERYFWVYWNWKYLDAGNADLNVFSFNLATTPDPDGDAGTWFKISTSIDAATSDYIDVMQLLYATSAETGPIDGTGIASIIFPSPQRQHNLWFAFRFDKGGGGDPGCKAWYYSIDDHGSPDVGDWIEMWDVTESNVDTVSSRFAFGAKVALDGKSNPIGWKMDMDDIQAYEDTDGAMTKLFHTSKDVIGVQVDANVTGYTDWGVSDGAKKAYRCVDDFNDSETMGTHDDDYITSSGTDNDQLFSFADLSSSTTIEAVMVYFETRTADGAGVNKILAGCKTEGVGPTVYLTGDTWHAFDNGHVALLLNTTPEGSPWTEDLVNKFYAGVRSPDANARQVRVVGIQVLGTGLTEPDPNAESDAGDVDDPWAAPPAVTFVPQVMQY